MARDGKLPRQFSMEYSMCANGLDLQDRSLGTCVLRGSQQEFHVKYRLPNSGWRNEVKAMQRLKHPHIIALEEVFEKPEQITLVMERTHGGDLYSLLARTSNYSERAAAEMLYNLLQAVEYMHHQRIIHCDLKLENVLLEHELPKTVFELQQRPDLMAAVKVANFSSALVVDDADKFTFCAGTPYYMAPDILRCGYFQSGPPWGRAIDLWSLGVIAFLVLVGQPPFVGTSRRELFTAITEGQWRFPPGTTLSIQGQDFVRGLLTLDPSARFTATEALRQPWIVARATHSDAPQDVPRSADFWREKEGTHMERPWTRGGRATLRCWWTFSGERSPSNTPPRERSPSHSPARSPHASPTRSAPGCPTPDGPAHRSPTRPSGSPTRCPPRTTPRPSDSPDRDGSPQHLPHSSSFNFRSRTPPGAVPGALSPSASFSSGTLSPQRAPQLPNRPPVPASTVVRHPSPSPVQRGSPHASPQHTRSPSPALATPPSPPRACDAPPSPARRDPSPNKVQVRPPSPVQTVVRSPSPAPRRVGEEREGLGQDGAIVRLPEPIEPTFQREEAGA